MGFLKIIAIILVVLVVVVVALFALLFGVMAWKGSQTMPPGNFPTLAPTAGATHAASATPTSEVFKACSRFCGVGAWEYMKQRNPTYIVSPDTGYCTLEKAFNLDPECFFTPGQISTYCQSANASIAHILNSDGTPLTEYPDLPPQNDRFCTYGR